jgi:serine/threonine protein kinase
LSGTPTAPGLPRVGDVVAGKYAVERLIGQGGMGVVLAARHQQLGELVAIKLLHPGSAKSESVTRLMREARATISIKSEHVVRVLDVGELDTGAPYILMEYLSGSDLSEIVRSRGALPVTEAVDYVLQACEAIAEAHARGIVHRDLKPSNLFLTQRADGSSLVKVLDFGISKALVPDEPRGDQTEPQVSLTATKSVFGSPAYMSPEQVRSAKRVDERTDIWALGVILHELITGVSPFPGESTPGVLAAIVADPPKALRAGRPDAPEELERVIARCLVKDVNARIQTVAELAKALGPFAPRGSEPSIERIERLARPGTVSRPAPFRSAPPPPGDADTVLDAAPVRQALVATVKAVTATTPGMSQPPRPRSALWAPVLGGALLVGVAILALRDRHGPSPAPPSSGEAPVTPIVIQDHPSATASPPTPSAAPVGDLSDHDAGGAVSLTATLPPAAVRHAPYTATLRPDAGHAPASPSASSRPVPTEDHALDGR